MAISAIGVGSGLPLDELLANLEKSERQSLNMLTTRATRENTRLSAYGTIKTNIETLQKAAKELGKAETFGGLKTSSTSEAFSASAATGAIAGRYNIKIDQLATTQSLKSATGQPDRAAALATGDINIEVELVNGEKTTLTVAAADTSLNGIMQAFNTSNSVGVSATMVNTGDTTNPYYLLMNARGTGTEAAVKSITVSGVDPATDVSALNDTFGFNQGSGGALVETQALNAEININGIDIVSQTNTVENAIEGITLTLNKENSSAENLSVSADTAVTEKAITAFVNAYNNLQNTARTLTAYNSENQTSSILTGDNLVRRIQSQITQALSAAPPSGAIANLGSMGITSDLATGTLQIDSLKLNEVLKNNMPDVKNLFAGDNGISTSIDTTSESFIRAGGAISSATDGLNRTIELLNTQYESASARISSRMEAYRTQFQKLDIMIAQMNSTSGYLTQQFSALANLNKRD